MSARLDFEKVYSDAGYFERAKVPGGWLVREVNEVYVSRQGGNPPATGYTWTTTLVFVPDAAHAWGERPVKEA